LATLQEVIRVPRRPTTGAREQVLDAAAALFYARGVRAVGMNEVVEAAGCGKNLLYAHFPSKVELVAAYLERFRARRDATAERVVREHEGDPAAQLVALTAEVARRAEAPGYRGCAMRTYLVEFPDADDAASRVARSYLRDSRAAVAALAARLDVADRDGVAERIWLVVEGLYASGARAADGAHTRTAATLVEEIIAGASRNDPT
jgi:AcrR family transcriptional regulator